MAKSIKSFGSAGENWGNLKPVAPRICIERRACGPPSVWQTGTTKKRFSIAVSALWFMWHPCHSDPEGSKNGLHLFESLRCPKASRGTWGSYQTPPHEDKQRRPSYLVMWARFHRTLGRRGRVSEGRGMRGRDFIDSVGGAVATCSRRHPHRYSGFRAIPKIATIHASSLRHLVWKSQRRGLR
jgi:hypothetical protein